MKRRLRPLGLLLLAVALGPLPVAAASSVALTGCGSSNAPHIQDAVKNPAKASAPFQDFERTHIAVGNKCIPVLVANTTSQRSQGLRAVRDTPGYSGMLFVFPSDTQVSFTMSETLVSLDIGFYNAQGKRVDHLRMTPCNGTDATCLLYTANSKFRFALETSADHLPSGDLRACKE